MQKKARGTTRRLDMRLVVGVVLVIAGGAGTTALVVSLDRTEPYVIVVRDVVAGETLTAGDVSTAPINPQSAAFPYLRGHHIALADGAMVTQSLRAGELVPSDALTHPLAADTTTLTLSLPLQGAPWLRPGQTVDVWLSPAIEQGLFGPPRVVAAGAVVAGVRGEEGFAADPSVVSIDIRVSRRDAPAVIGALANAFPMTVTPVTGGPNR